MSLSHLLNDPSAPPPSLVDDSGGPTFIGSASPSTASTPTATTPIASGSTTSRRKRSNKVVSGTGAAAMVLAGELDDDAQSRRSSRQSTRPKRYVEDGEHPFFDNDNNSPRPSFSNGQHPPTEHNNDDEDLDSDSEQGLLLATAHLWREPLETYVQSLHLQRRQIEQASNTSDASRQFSIAARIVSFSEQRLPTMLLRKETRLIELATEEEWRVKEEEQQSLRRVVEEEKRVEKEREKEERLKKQREGAKRKREEERKKKGRDEESRKVRSEESKAAKAREVERRAGLSLEERDEEDRMAEERARRERERRMGVEGGKTGDGEGRGARKRKKKDLDGGDAGGGGEGDYPPSAEYPSYSPYYPPSAGAPPPLDPHGNPYAPYGYPVPPPPPPLPHGAYVGPDGLYYDVYGQPLPIPMAPSYPPYGGSPYSHGGYDSDGGLLSGEDEEDGEGAEGETKEGEGEGTKVEEGGEGVEGGGTTGTNTPKPKAPRKKPKLSVEELEKRAWTNIAKRDIPKVAKIAQQSTSSRQFFAKRLSTIVAREARRAATRTKGVKDVQTRAKKVMREMMVFMKGNEKKERESRKKAEKEALDKAKKEEEVREAKRAARKLNFLITQTELYSHFVGNKIKTSEAEDSADTAGAAPAPPAQKSASLLAAIAASDAPVGSELKELDFDEDDETSMAQHARRNAQAAVDAAKNAAAAFDAAAASANGVAPVAPRTGADGLNFDSDDLNFQNPTSMNGDVLVKQPKILACTLKEYQLKGLNWLANLYEQGINGILADEMGLGKTVQSISLMAYLAEVHDIWGPFLVIAPASTLHNWQQEITRFVPSLKALPYWGNTKDRAVLRKFWNRKSLKYDKDAPFHILVTSYQLVVQDEKYFQGVKWQYMVLDEAQAIKSSTSARWKTLLGFRCRNRLLLTGTPIQNSMHELWALLHFIMPSLFDSHDEFSEWFSKDIEGNAEKNGAMNEHQLRRLHMILKPFMLRRIKKNVQNELGDKIEIDLYCDLTPRQKLMYRTLRQHISITDLVSRSSSLDNNDDSVKRLMNLIMQFRKVCNHPELFERADVTAPLAFASFNLSANLVRDPEALEVPYATKSVIEFEVPKLVYRDGGMLNVVGEKSRAGSDTLHLDRLMNIWTPDHIQQSLKKDESTFAFAKRLNLSPSELSQSVRSHGILRVGLALERDENARTRESYEAAHDADSSSPISFAIPTKASTLPLNTNWRSLGLTPLGEIEQTYRLSSRLAKPDARFYMDKVVAPTINAVCSDRSFVYDQQRERFDPLFSAALFGLPSTSQNSELAIKQYQTALPGFAPQGILSASDTAQLPFPPMQVPQLQKLILDSGKLAKLDTLLTELKANGHRVLVYFQMTRMIDLMEEYLAFRQYKYLRLDGGSTISERRDMVMDWQTKPELFIFLLSTRAGGLGINLTAADTVIFYDSDWNPSNDAQAMDRAHRLGQTKQVTVYRLITKDTVDERIVQLARNKKLVQDAVVGSSSGAPTEGPAKANEVVSLLLDDNELEEGLRQAELKRKRAEEKAKEDGQKGAKTREEAKRKKAEAALEATKIKPSWETQDDDDDAFSFFANPGNKVAPGDDDEPGSPSAGGSGSGAGTGGTATPQPQPAATTTTKAPRKRKVELGPDGQPKPKRKRRTKAEMEAARAAGLK